MAAITREQDIAQALMRPVEDDERQFIDSMIAYLEAVISEKLPNAAPRAAVEPGYRIIYARVVAEAVARVLRAPGGGLFKYETEGTYTYSVNNAVASGILEIRPDEWRLLGHYPQGWATVNTTTDDYLKDRYRYLKEGVYMVSVRPPERPDPPAADILGVRPWGDW